MWAEAWLEELPRALRSVWAGALGPVPLDVWWAQGDRDRTYTVASWLPLPHRRQALSWYAALDPEPASERVLRAMTRAFRGVSEGERRWLVGTMPLGTPELIKLARSSRNDFAANQMLRARQRDELSRASAGDDQDERPLREAWQAASRVQSLAPAWAAAAQSWQMGSHSVQRMLILPTREVRAWRELPASLDEQVRAAAAFVAALSSEAEAEEVLKQAPRSLSAHGLAALARPEVPERWAELIRSAEDPTEAYLEGLYTSDERWTILAGKAACDRDRGMMLDQLSMKVMIDAQGAAASWADEVRRRCLGERVEATIPKLVGRIGKELAAPAPRRFMIERQLSALAAAGGRMEAVPIVEELERRGLASARVAKFAAGRSLAVLAADGWADAELVAALAADGHLDEARKHLPELLSSKPSSQTLLDLARAIALLEPESTEALTAALSVELERLPGSSASEARAWLSGSPDD